MRKWLLSCMLLMFVSEVFSQDGHEVYLYDEPVVNIGKEKKNEKIIFSVHDYGDYVGITSECVTNAFVVISDINGNVIYQESIICSECEIYIQLDSDDWNNKHCIEIETQEEHLYGFFNKHIII